MKKIYTLILALLFAAFFMLLICNKNIINGNNTYSKSVEELKNELLNTKSYRATVEVTIVSNKNKNKYILKQEYSKNYAKQEVILPENIRRNGYRI